MTNLSPHFTFEELTRTDHRNLENIPNELETQNLYRLADFLEQVRALMGGKPIMVTSAYRSKALNRAVGSKNSSQHRLGCACDFRVPGMTPDEVVRLIIGSALPFQQVIREFNSWTHVSITNEEGQRPRLQALIIDRDGTRAFA